MKYDNAAITGSFSNMLPSSIVKYLNSSSTVKYQFFSLDLDVTGSPLKADFDPNEVFDNSMGNLMVTTKKTPKPLYR